VDTESYRFKLGDFECVSLSDGSLDYPLKNFFANVPMAQIEEALCQRNLPMDYVTTPYTCLYIDTGEHRVLVDMGAGHLGPRTGRLLQNMKAADIDPADIDTIFITHAHAGHIGGALDDEGRPVYVNASYFMWKEEWRFWASEIAFTKAPERFVTVARENLGSIQDRLGLVEHETEILPGIRAIPAPGHTPGHMVALIFSGDEQLMYIGDTVLYPLHLEHPDWVPIYDIMPEEAAASKRRIFDRAAEEKVLVMGPHFPPFPSLGYVVRKGEGWQWQPVETMDQIVSKL
jgi:glyoxylase-like metal-dependent hydrolase (beta-lactamase superfamily II)